MASDRFQVALSYRYGYDKLVKVCVVNNLAILMYSYIVLGSDAKKLLKFEKMQASLRPQKLFRQNCILKVLHALQWYL